MEEKKSARKLKHWKAPFMEPSPSYRDRQRKPTKKKDPEVARAGYVEVKATNVELKLWMCGDT